MDLEELKDILIEEGLAEGELFTIVNELENGTVEVQTVNKSNTLVGCQRFDNAEEFFTAMFAAPFENQPEEVNERTQ